MSTRLPGLQVDGCASMFYHVTLVPKIGSVMFPKKRCLKALQVYLQCVQSMDDTPVSKL